MHRLFIRSFLAAALLLLAAVAAAGAWVDPFALFRAEDRGLDREPAYTLNRSLYKVVELERAAAAADPARPLLLLVGDSMSNQLGSARLRAATGQPWVNMSYGGATLEENVSLLRDLLARDAPVAEIVWSLPFTRLRALPRNTIPRSLAMARNPLRHLLTYESVLASWYVMRKRWFGVDFKDEAVDLPEDRRVAYFLYRMRADLEGVAWPDRLAEEVAGIERLAEVRGVRLTFLVIPAHPEARRIFAEEFPDRYRRYRALLDGRRCTVDLERDGGPRWMSEKFVDAVHLKPQHRGELVAAFAEARRRPCRRDPAAAAPAVASRS